MNPGDSLGPYRLGALLGSGGMGEVYLARDARLNRDVAIKILSAAFASDADRLRRFQTEARSVGALNHPNILTVFDAGLEEDRPYLVTELLQGESLRDRLRNGRLPRQKAIDIARQTAAGLAAAHAKGIVHRDIKPENLFITTDGRLKILDFGLAKSQAEQPLDTSATRSQITAAGSIMGTAYYMSPEQALGRPVDGRSDLFSLGSVIYEMLTGRRPFEGDNAIAVMHGILNDDPPDLRALLPDVPPVLDRIVRRCLEKAPDERFQTAGELAFALETLLLEPASVTSVPVPPVAPRRRLSWRYPVAVLALLLTAAAGYLLHGLLDTRVTPTFQRLTFRRGNVSAARFTPDGGGVVYSSQWEDEPVELFDVRFDTPGARPLSVRGASLRAVSPSGELAIAQDLHLAGTPFAPAGLLARVPMSGGMPRAIETNVNFADWSADGKEMALVRETETGIQLEFPRGKVLYKTGGYISNPRISPDGMKVAFLDHPVAFDNGGDVAVIDRAGTKTTLARQFSAADGLAWSADGKEIWFTATRTGSRNDLRAVSLSGRERLIFSQTSAMVLHDIAKDGRVLLVDQRARTKLVFRSTAESRDRELSWLDWSLVSSLSSDGKMLAFFESGDGAGRQSLAYLRETDGKPAVLLGTGQFPILSSDGASVVVAQQDPSQITIYPTGPGQSRTVATTGYAIDHAGLLPDGKRAWFSGSQPSHGRRLYVVDLEHGGIKPVSEEGITISVGFTPDASHVLATQGGAARLFDVDGGPPVELPRLGPGERIAGFTTDRRALYVYSRNELPARVYRADLATGRRDLAFTIQPSDSAGVLNGLSSLQIVLDGKAYTYSLLQLQSELHAVRGLR